MTSLLSVYSTTGFVGMCNSNCYDGKNPSELHDKNEHFPCRCICGGINHAVGLTKALKNINDHGIGLRRSDIEAYAQERGLNPDDLMVIDRTRVHSDYTARRLVKARLQPVPIGSDDLFYCEGLATAPADRGPALGSGAGAATNTASPPGDPAETAEPLVISRR